MTIIYLRSSMYTQKHTIKSVIWLISNYELILSVFPLSPQNMLFIPIRRSSELRFVWIHQYIHCPMISILFCIYSLPLILCIHTFPDGHCRPSHSDDISAHNLLCNHFYDEFLVNSSSDIMFGIIWLCSEFVVSDDTVLVTNHNVCRSPQFLCVWYRSG